MTVVVTPSRGTGAARLGRPKFGKNTVLFVTGKQPSSIAIRWSTPVLRAGVHPPKSSAFHGAIFRPTIKRAFARCTR
jgi:hypothetical protein